MATIVSSIGLRGMEGYPVQVEVQLIPSVSGVSIVGLPDASVKEAKVRVMSALFANNCHIPQKVVINLSPAEQRKNSPIFDLAIAIGVMRAANFIRYPIPSDAAFLGLLSLDGTIKPVEGMLPAILAAKKEGFKILYLPLMENFPLRQIQGLELRFVRSLNEVVQSLSGQLSYLSFKQDSSSKTSQQTETSYDKDFKHILGHEKAKRALEIAAAGGHNILMSGPPGCGKSLLAETFPSIFPPLTQDAQFEVMSIYQLAGISNESFHLAPFRNPHHSSSAVSLIGGGSYPKPGEISLSHHGVLFLDEMAEFPKRTLDMLRQPIETGKVTISRAASTVTYPAQFLLLGAMNPCPCGYLGSRYFYCTCTPKQISSYTNRVSGPIQDRMDVILSLEAVSIDKESIKYNESSEQIRKRVENARIRQYDRYSNERLNANVASEFLLKGSNLDSNQQKMVHQWQAKYNWSTRVQMKVLRIARTISDLNGDEQITNEALWEAMTMRRSIIGKNKTVVAK
ncbi:YifB family Mg chelatase-like AAA ATPase [Aquibacillus albus]|uniref:Magnesium chelatase family protein n=1 Tax=Aquibacillus albus TaxID=1168171 RepID=A0ABS2MWA4_9BACI|nr:YifB family Mg chelatase-like AAA ATPase [Aquibacillus albus]MBM7570063.1 magnesium chelatase family protein [Aquibacillus albus]